jgi:phosphatidylethanolamine/phosphatidyl-N-methylethanolamine N-methyltransferase
VNQNNVIRTYKYYAPIYDSLFGRVLEDGRRKMCDVVHSIRPRDLLEVGVGTGLTLGQYPAATNVTGIDLSQEMLDRAAARTLPPRTGGLQLLRMDAEALEFPDDSFDCVVLPYVLSVTPDPRRLVAEVRRVCKPHGHILIVNHFSGSGFWFLFERLASRMAARIGFRSTFDYAEHIEQHGWQVLSARTANPLGLSKVVHICNAKR